MIRSVRSNNAIRDNGAQTTVALSTNVSLLLIKNYDTCCTQREVKIKRVYRTAVGFLLRELKFPRARIVINIDCYSTRYIDGIVGHGEGVRATRNDSVEFFISVSCLKFCPSLLADRVNAI